MRTLTWLGMVAVTTTGLLACGVDWTIDPTAESFPGKGSADPCPSGCGDDPSCGRCPGAPCAQSAECAAGFCVDGVCCETACDGPCQACDDPLSPGICRPRSGSDGPCAGTYQCNLRLECLSANGQPCMSQAECASHLCSSGVCAGCGPNNLCPGELPCVNGICATKGIPGGEPCAADAMCTSDHCADGVCCESACDGLCMACHIDYTGEISGTCAPLLPGYDPHGECTGPGNAATCSGQLPDPNGNSSCGSN